MGKRAGLIVAMLLVAMAFLAGPAGLLPDRLSAAAPAAPAEPMTPITSERGQRADDDLRAPSWTADRLLLNRRRVAGLPQSRRTRRTAARQAAATASATASGVVSADPPWPDPTGRSPETLQVFRC